MPLEPEFKKHLHSLMVEVAENTSDEWVQHKNELVGKAVATHNSAAVPIAYKDAELYRMELRLSKTIEKYVEAVANAGYAIDPAFERDMIGEFQLLTAGPNQLHFPPAIKGQHAQAVQGAYARERQRLVAKLLRQGTNRLQELKMKTSQAKRAAVPVLNTPVNSALSQPIASVSENGEVLMLQPNFYGIGVNLRTLWRRMTRRKG
jgi:hypothetical protein